MTHSRCTSDLDLWADDKMRLPRFLFKRCAPSPRKSPSPRSSSPTLGAGPTKNLHQHPAPDSNPVHSGAQKTRSVRAPKQPNLTEGPGRNWLDTPPFHLQDSNSGPSLFSPEQGAPADPIRSAPSAADPLRLFALAPTSAVKRAKLGHCRGRRRRSSRVWRRMRWAPPILP